ncbi:nucleotidyltransferase domain-containing protein [bacterium]|nr:nucleotidyltransferase domain-containing protein [bacterium]
MISKGGAEALFGKTRLAVLALFFTHPEREFYLRQVSGTVKTGQGAVQRELARLAACGILLRTRKGRQVFYQANRDCPFFGELKSLLVKTGGVADVLRRALAGFGHNIRIAFVFGSFATNSAQARSDIDLAVIGAVSFGEVVSALSEAQETLAREINPVVYSEEEFKGQAARKHFVGKLKGTEKIYLIGSADEFDRLVE